MNKPTIDLLKIGITALKKQRGKEESWQKTFNEMFDGHFVSQYSTELECAIIKMLEIAYNDQTQTISWWVYEQDFGKKCKEKPAMWDKEGAVNLRNIDELYAFLIKDGFKEKSVKEKETPKSKKSETKKHNTPELDLNNIMNLFEKVLNDNIEDFKKSKENQIKNQKQYEDWNTSLPTIWWVLDK